MELMKIERLNHLGVVGGVIKDLSLIELIDARIPPSDREEITTGQAIAAMILNGLGFSNRPISLTPQFFENKPVELLFGTGVMADHFNRFKLGRSLDKVFAYGCDLLFSEIALSVCGQEGIACQFNCLDTTSFSLYGDYVPETDEQAISHLAWLFKGSSTGPEAGDIGIGRLPRWWRANYQQELGWQCR